MSEVPTSQQQARDLGRARMGAAYAFVLLALSVTSAAWPRPGANPRPDFSLDGWRPDPARLAPVWARQEVLAERYPLDAAGQKVLDTLAALGRAEAEAEGRQGPTSEAAQTAALVATEAAVGAASAYWFDRGRDAFLALGVHAGRAAGAALDAVLAASREEPSRRGLRIWLIEHATDPRVARLRDTSGTFVEHAVGWGLITDDGGYVAGGQELVRIHLRCRWVLLVTEITDYTFLLEPEELRALWRWRVEGDRNLPMERRIEAARRLKQDLEPTYPVFRVLGSLYALRGENTKALLNFREAVLDDPFDEQAIKNLDYLLRSREASALNATPDE